MLQRKDARVAMNRPVEIRNTRGVSQGTISDFSPGGCCIRQTDTQVHCGMRLTLMLSLPDRLEPLEIKSARVTWISPHMFGVEFFSVSPEAKARVKEVYRQLLDAQKVEEVERIIALPAFN